MFNESTEAIIKQLVVHSKCEEVSVISQLLIGGNFAKISSDNFILIYVLMSFAVRSVDIIGLDWKVCEDR